MLGSVSSTGWLVLCLDRFQPDPLLGVRIIESLDLDSASCCRSEIYGQVPRLGFDATGTASLGHTRAWLFLASSGMRRSVSGRQATSAGRYAATATSVPLDCHGTMAASNCCHMSSNTARRQQSLCSWADLPARSRRSPSSDRRVQRRPDGASLSTVVKKGVLTNLPNPVTSGRSGRISSCVPDH